MEAYCVREFASALEVIPYTLAENAGLNPIEIVSQLRALHAAGNKYHGINVKKVWRLTQKLRKLPLLALFDKARSSLDFSFVFGLSCCW